MPDGWHAPACRRAHHLSARGRSLQRARAAAQFRQFSVFFNEQSRHRSARQIPRDAPHQRRPILRRRQESCGLLLVRSPRTQAKTHTRTLAHQFCGERARTAVCVTVQPPYRRGARVSASRIRSRSTRRRVSGRISEQQEGANRVSRTHSLTLLTLPCGPVSSTFRDGRLSSIRYALSKLEHPCVPFLRHFGPTIRAIPQYPGTGQGKLRVLKGW